MAYTINSSGSVKSYERVATQLKTISGDVNTAAKSLASSNNDKSIDIVESKLYEVAKELESISSEITSFARSITTATNQVNDEIKKAEEARKV